jgi:AcrR family transcriptional regulator
MVRTRAPRRLEEIVEAATVVFLEKGYRLARMDEIARQAGVSPGLLYTYAEGKEALFQLVQLRELGVDISQSALPVSAPSADEIAAVARRAFKELAAVPALEAAMKTDDPVDAPAELAGIIREQYERVHQFRRFVRLTERSALDWPEMAERYYVRGRKNQIRRLASYISARVASGDLAPVPDAEVAARFVIEAVAWFANHRYGDFDGAQIPDDIAEETVVQVVTAGLVGEAMARAVGAR